MLKRVKAESSREIEVLEQGIIKTLYSNAINNIIMTSTLYMYSSSGSRKTKGTIVTNCYGRIKIIENLL
jgi:hypothetical protein